MPKTIKDLFGVEVGEPIRLRKVGGELSTFIYEFDKDYNLVVSGEEVEATINPIRILMGEYVIIRPNKELKDLYELLDLLVSVKKLMNDNDFYRARIQVLQSITGLRETIAGLEDSIGDGEFGGRRIAIPIALNGDSLKWG